MFSEKIKFYANNLPKKLLGSNVKIAEVTDELIETIKFIDFNDEVLPIWIPQIYSNYQSLFCDYDRILEILSHVVGSSRIPGTPPLDTFWEMVQDPDKIAILPAWEEVTEETGIFIVERLVEVLDSPNFAMKHADKLMNLCEKLMDENPREFIYLDMLDCQRKFANVRNIINRIARFNASVCEATRNETVEVQVKKSVQLDLLSACLKILPSIIYDETKKDLLDLVKFPFKSSLNYDMSLKLENILRNNVVELNAILFRNRDMKWLYLFLSTYPNLVYLSSKLNYIEDSLENNPREARQFIKECFNKLKYETRPIYVEKYTVMVKTLFEKMVFDEQTKREFVEFANENKLTIEKCFDIDDVLTDFLYSIFASNPSSIPFESKVKNISKVLKKFKTSDQLNLLAECLQQFQNGRRFSIQDKIAVAFFSLLSENFKDQEIYGINLRKAEHSATIKNMLFLVVDYPEAKQFYAMFNENQWLLGFETKMLYFGKGVLDLTEKEQMEFLSEILDKLQDFDNTIIMFDYLYVLEKLLSNLCETEYGEHAKSKILEFAMKNTSLVFDEIQPQSREEYFRNLRRLIIPIWPKESLQTRLATVQSNLGNRADLTLTVDRLHVLSSSCDVTSELKANDWRTMKFKINFNNEPGVDMGGLLREWFTITTREILNPDFGLFIPTPGDANRYMINKSSHINDEHLKLFKFIGRFLANGILENIHLDCPLTKVLYKKIVDVPLEYTDFESQDPEFFNSLCYILNNPISEAGLDLTFSTEIEHFGAFEEKELIRNGKNIPVTDENKQQYVELISAMKMTESIRGQLKEFLDGFYDVIPKYLIKMFDDNELEMILCGQSEIDIEDMKTNTTYSNYQESDDVIQWFWQALESFDKDDKTRFLKFVTGSSKAPLNGFSLLQGSNGIQMFNICEDLIAGDRLPTAHTCFNRLDLPRYESYGTLREKLLLAIREGTEGFGMS